MNTTTDLQLSDLTAQEFINEFDFASTETAKHWSDLYEGKSSFAIIVSSDEELELLKRAISLNGWAGEWGELRKRDGEHHSTFDSYYDINDYRSSVEQRFDAKFDYIDKETEEGSFLEQIKEADDLDEVRAILTEFDELEEGYYDDELLIRDNSNFDDFWGYSYDVYTYSFGFKLDIQD